MKVLYRDTGMFVFVRTFVTFHSYSQHFLVANANANKIAFIRNVLLLLLLFLSMFYVQM